MKVVTYFRVSTAKQGRSGLGLEAQASAVQSFCSNRSCNVLGSYTEVETGKNADRPELIKALTHAKVTGATLIIAKLDRLSRNAAFLLTLQDAGVKFVAADMSDANNMTIGVMALIAQQEAEAISRRTSEALQALKARGVRLGNPNGAEALRRAQKGNLAAVSTVKAKAAARAADLTTTINDIRAAGHVSLSKIAVELNAREIRTPRGGRWHPSTVSDLLKRLDATPG